MEGHHKTNLKKKKKKLSGRAAGISCTVVNPGSWLSDQRVRQFTASAIDIVHHSPVKYHSLFLN